MTLDLFLGRLVLLELLLLQVDGTGEVGDPFRGERGPARGVDEALGVTGAHDLLIVDGDVLEQRKEVDLLLVVCAD
jgi:hypothetical protein